MDTNVSLLETPRVPLASTRRTDCARWIAIWGLSVLGVSACLLLPSESNAQEGVYLEAGGFAGWYGFNADNELGVVDTAPSEALGDSAILGARLSWPALSFLWLEGEFALIPSEHPTTNTDVNVLAYRTHALVPFLSPDSDLLPFATLGVGGLTAFSDNTDNFDDDTDFLVHAGLGMKVRTGDKWGFRTDARLLLPPSSRNDTIEADTLDFELMLGVYRSFGGEERARSISSGTGDTDGDGILDGTDRCPFDAEDFDKFEDDDGCPDLDNDRDGILDKDDKCINEPETANGFEDDDGCPETDTDGDGLYDGQDKCIDEPEDKDDFEDSDGCPDPDNDQDGVLDADDKCPMQRETPNQYQDNDGCPDEVPKEVALFSGAIKGIQFKLNSHEILPRSFKTLDQAVKVLSDFPDLRIEIQGHTDNTGKPATNKALSDKRAKSVLDYLVGKGIDAERLRSKGYGESKPVADNKSAAGRKQNRRVEFKRLK